MYPFWLSLKIAGNIEILEELHECWDVGAGLVLVTIHMAIRGAKPEVHEYH